VVTPRSVEIGDLLLIRTLVVNKIIKERRALLLQAKKVKSIPASPGNKNQWHLYEQWPAFTYAGRSGKLTGKKRHIKEPDMYDAAKYLLIGSGGVKHPCCKMCCMDCISCLFCLYPEICIHQSAQPTRHEISRYRCFANEILEFIAGNAGKVFDKPLPRTRGYNRVIDDLIYETAKAKSKFMKDKGNSTRGGGILFFTTPTELNEFFHVAGAGGVGESGKPPDVPEKPEESSDWSGISMIEVVIEQTEEEQKNLLHEK
jgi:hypothetical protein